MKLFPSRRALAATATLAVTVTGAQAQVFFAALSDQPTLSNSWDFLATCPAGDSLQVLASYAGAEALTWDGCGFNIVPRPPASMNLPFAMAQDPMTSEASAIGSRNSGRLVASNFNGTTWSNPVFVDSNPRFSHTAAAMPSISQTVVFGGLDPVTNVFLDNLLTWDGATATPQALAGGPDPRAFHAMSTDSATGSVLMHGGISSTNGLESDTWVLSSLAGGALQWQQLTLANSPALQGHGMAFDSSRGVHMMYGGFTTGGAPNAAVYELDLNAATPAWTIVSASPVAVGGQQALIWQTPGYDHLMVAGISAVTGVFRAEFGIQTGSTLATPLVRPQDCQTAFFDLAAPGQCGQLGTNVTVSPSGLPIGSIFALFGDFAYTSVPGTCILTLTAAANPVPTTFSLPANPALVGLDLFLQGVTVDSSGAIQTSDVCQFRLGN